MNTPAKAVFPGQSKAESVTFGQTPSPSTPTDLHNGTWLVTTPWHAPEEVTVTIAWSLNGSAEPDDTTNTYKYIQLGVLPLTGQQGIMAALLVGLMLASSGLAAKRHRMSQKVNGIM